MQPQDAPFSSSAKDPAAVPAYPQLSIVSWGSSMKTILIGTLLALCFFPFISSAQNESGVRPIDIDFVKAWNTYYDSTTATCEWSRTVLTSIPPVGFGRPSAINYFYSGIDSLLRVLPPHVLKQVIESYLPTDTARSILALLYNAVDYDPMLFHQYALETELHRKVSVATGTGDTVIVGRYLSSLWDAKWSFFKRYRKELKDSVDGLAKSSLIASSIVARVTIRSIDSIPDDSAMPKPGMRYVVIADILDTLQGFIGWNTYVDQNKLLNGTKIGSGDRTQTTSPPQIVFTYHTLSYQPEALLQESSIATLYPNAHQMTTDTNGLLKLRIDKDYIVFLTFQSPKIDSTRDYFQPAIFPQACRGVLYIDENENVKDVNNLFSTTGTITWSAFVEKFDALRSSIKSGWTW